MDERSENAGTEHGPEPKGEAGRRLSVDMDRLLVAANGQALSLGAMQQILGGRGFGLLVLILALPFSSPVTIPGLSIPFGIVILWMSVRFALGKPPTIPGFLKKRMISFAILRTLVALAGGLSRRLETFVKRRSVWVFQGKGMRMGIGFCLGSGGFLLCLPFPPVIPFSNTVPALGVILVAAGLLEGDGLLVLLGAVVSLVAWVYLSWMVWLLGDVLHRFASWMGWMS
jgi:hypothetical protein